MEKFERVDDQELASATGGAPGVKTNWGATAKTWGNILSGKSGGYWGGYGNSGGGGSSGGGQRSGAGGSGSAR